MAAYYPAILRKYPHETSGLVSDLRPEIYFDWTLDIDSSQFSTPSTLASIVSLYNESTSTLVPISYVSYDTLLKRVIIQPNSNLDRSTAYTVTVDAGVLGSGGRRSRLKYLWGFETSESSIGYVTLSTPVDQTVQETFPLFTWATAATGSPTFLFELTDVPDFSNTLYQTTTPGTSLIPVGSFLPDTTYYWRVQVYSALATSAWSDVSSFHYATRQAAHIGTRQEWYQPRPFQIDSIDFFDGASNQASYPTLTIRFTEGLASTYASYLTVTKRSVLPRNDEPSSFLKTAVAGSWAVTNTSALTFTPSEAISSNTRYEITVGKNLASSEGASLGSDTVYYFTGSYSPYYANMEEIRARFLSALSHLPDDLINYHIYKASIAANVHYYGIVGLDVSETLAREAQGLSSYGVGRWVEAYTTYKLLQSLLAELSTSIGLRRELGDFSIQRTADSLKAFQMLLEEAKNELTEATYFMEGGPDVDITIAPKGELYTKPMFSNNPYIRKDNCF